MFLLSLMILISCTSESTKDSSLEDKTEYIPEVVDDLSWVNPDDLPAATNPCRSPVRVLVRTIFDGDTFVAQSEEGDETIRIIGVDTPETSTGQCYAAEAKSFLIQQKQVDMWLHLMALVKTSMKGRALCSPWYKRTRFSSGSYYCKGCQSVSLMIQIHLKCYLLKMKHSRSNGAGGWTDCDW